ncbi:putative quinol monooxygenase [Paraflavitalea sp. CAU 1676]|uniref:putative quinol monooxygenase n=1 Tax=Paraflavitalea sp. CAU 1676 TaxID=3032598 RepID=UPI0023DB3830|nr:putative quinol monooxygenase [Paraflavitalea sp. CAU 1676]MDF2187924.1 putative quinol monooxygenase [Paraflavitalea sp. CAU 1676]
MATIPIHVFAQWKVKEGNLEIVLDLLKVVRSQTIQEPGNLFYMVHQSKADENTLLLFEGYTDEVAQKAHTSSEHFKLLVIEQIVPLLDQREVTLAIPITE